MFRISTKHRWAVQSHKDPPPLAAETLRDKQISGGGNVGKGAYHVLTEGIRDIRVTLQ
jgi:hypothetical protein